ncbi:hypothetical protein [Mesorhizobium sp. ANAO-SY3R2]|uniref:hypothetical protein n=1 Tax=Mesorhizobium sp. ANAO-SY3R2 TaxID=3166644 RepID=UPI003672130A
MRRYLSILACSGLLSLGALYGAPAFAGSIPRSISDIAPTVGSAWNGDLGGGVQFVRGGGGSHGGGHGGMGGGHGGMIFPQRGGFHHGFHGQHFDHGRHFHNDHFNRFRNDNFFFNDGGDSGIGWYSYCDPYYSSYYGSCYPGY